MKGVKHYKKSGVEHKGNTHKMSDGSIHSGKSHTKASVKIIHYNQLSKTAKAVADGVSRKSKKA